MTVMGPELFGRLVDEHAAALVLYARQWCAAPEDVVQETFLRLWADSLRGTIILDPEAWAFRVAYRLAMDQHRLSRRACAIADRLSASSVGEELDPADRVAVWAVVDRLPPRQRAVIYLRYRADLSFERIGMVMGITANGARNNASVATAALRERFGKGRR